MIAFFVWGGKIQNRNKRSALKMASALKVFENSSPSLPERLVSEVARLELEDLSVLICYAASNAMLKMPAGCVVSADPIFKFAREINTWAGVAGVHHARPNSRTAEAAGLLLSLSKELTGPERALAAAVKLYHEGTDEANARAINMVNDEQKGAFISNITMAIISNVRNGFLEEIKTEGHSIYRVSAEGFSAFEALHRKLGKLVAAKERQSDAAA